MRIGIDIDGVLTDLESYIFDYGIKYCVENNLTYKIIPGYYEERKVLGISEENEEKFWNSYLKHYATEYKARDFASEIIKKLKEEGHEIYIVTARNEWGLTGEDYGKMKEFVKKWLEDNEIYYDRIIYTNDEMQRDTKSSKVKYCVGNYIDVMIEDSPKNIKEISKKIPVLCYHSSYNENVAGRNIKRVYSWYDIYNKIKNGNLK